jgi:hypothetical protein
MAWVHVIARARYSRIDQRDIIKAYVFAMLHEELKLKVTQQILTVNFWPAKPKSSENFLSTFPHF